MERLISKDHSSAPVSMFLLHERSMLFSSCIGICVDLNCRSNLFWINVSLTCVLSVCCCCCFCCCCFFSLCFWDISDFFFKSDHIWSVVFCTLFYSFFCQWNLKIWKEKKENSSCVSTQTILREMATSALCNIAWWQRYYICFGGFIKVSTMATPS
jgi:hypothetical protein